MHTKKYSRKNGYYKFYNKEGIPFRIKFAGIRDIEFENSREILVKFKDQDEIEWKFHSPSKKFNNVFDIIKYIGMNLENTNVVFKIQFMKESDRKF